MVTSFLNNNRITQTTITPHQPKSNSRAKRINITLMNAALSSMSHSLLPPIWTLH